VRGRMRSPRPAAKTMTLAKLWSEVPTQSLEELGSELESTVFKRMALCCHAVGLAQAPAQ
jgi:hypothetical protein